ncbi:conserved Plasmodium protein, unknown function [Plasmodium malariae]|uniref:ATPase AAA-type core domain-containing protein n=1 Tax=Plasmodium malariae TaxID=5858 RepID=A0A1C3KYL7_PLAMA|nr:conserved Plasmodium protein, unknown function [Plasmodium malariae]
MNHAKVQTLGCAFPRVPMEQQNNKEEHAFLEKFCSLFMHEIEELKLQSDQLVIYEGKKSNELKKNGTAEGYDDGEGDNDNPVKVKDEQVEAKKGHSSSSSSDDDDDGDGDGDGEKKSENYNYLEHGREYRKLLFLFSCIGKELFMDGHLMIEGTKKKKKKKKFVVQKNHFVIKYEKNFFTISSENKHIYAVVATRNDELDVVDEYYLNVYSLYQYCRERYANRLKYYYIQITNSLNDNNFITRKIIVYNLSEQLWNSECTKEDIKKKLICVEHSKCLCFILSYSILIKEYKIFVADLVRRLNKKKGNSSSTFYILEKNVRTINMGEKKKNLTSFDEREAKKKNAHTRTIDHEENILKKKKFDIPRNKKEAMFYSRISSIFNLLKEQNIPLLKFYNLENYTRIFIYNCENMNKNNFVFFLKKFEHFRIYFINLNTLFGLYFSETEQNILNVFKKCTKIVQHSTINVCLVIDGIDIVAGGLIREKRMKDYNEKGSGNGSGNGIGGGNDKSRLLATLLLCLDSIDNSTVKKIKRIDLKRLFQREEMRVKGMEKKKIKTNHKKKMGNFCLSDDSPYDSSTDNNTDEHNVHKRTYAEKFLPKKKKENLSERVTYDIKKLEKFYKEKFQLTKKKEKKKNLSVIVLSDKDIKHFDTSLTRAGRFFHFIKYS